MLNRFRVIAGGAVAVALLLSACGETTTARIPSRRSIPRPALTATATSATTAHLTWTAADGRHELRHPAR